MGLKDYRAKRKFPATPEPEPGPGKAGERLTFVVQKHAARALHYDLRLELEGVLKSWAVPKGPSLDPANKRLAVQVEDHPLDYRDFEGLIPKGHYGAGSVIVWDRGFYRHPLAADRRKSERLLKEGLAKGDLKFILEGEKLRGEFALVKTRQDEKSWLLLKKKDSFATTADVLAKDRSVVSDRRIEEIALGESQPASGQKRADPVGIAEILTGEELKGAPKRPMPRHIRPMLATLVREPFDHPDWLFEVKWDGYRAVAEIRKGNVALYSRNGISLDQKFAPIRESLATFGFEALLDGEIVVTDEAGNPDFQRLQDYPKNGKGPLLYQVFDLLHFAGHDLTALPLLRRKEILKSILPDLPNVKFSDHVVGEGILFFQVARERGLEGIMAKEAQSTYRLGVRSRQWQKVKRQLTQEGVIGGFTKPKGGRRHFGALVLGVFAGERLVPIGHVGGGFTAGMLREIHTRLTPLIREKGPFAVTPATNGPVTWVEPELVCEVRFQGWTAEGLMRQPVFLRLREDKAAREVLREIPAPEGPPLPSPRSAAGEGQLFH
ncbi:MAG: non-homologous end-joining DNA ligase [Deltaproteobacteria bacterium]|nr:non-homologous end-joining DNA ligase [Deltaproteobacteria bacterium]